MTKPWKEYNKLTSIQLEKLHELNDLNGSKWAQMSKSVQKFNGGIAKKRKEHGAAFPISLAKQLIEIFTQKGDLVLDPFLGVGTTTDAAQLLGRDSIGFEINKNFIKLAKQGIDKIDRSKDDFNEETKEEIIHDNCLNIKKYIKNNSIDFVLTSPPYFNLLNNTIDVFGGTNYKKNIYNSSKRSLAKPYSTDPQDFGNLKWEDFCKNVTQLMTILFDVSKAGTYNVWIVRDFRDMQNKIPYVNLHNKIVELASKAGWILTDIVIWDQTDQRHLVKLGGKKSRRFYFNIGHSYAVILRKNIEGEKFTNSN